MKEFSQKCKKLHLQIGVSKNGKTFQKNKKTKNEKCLKIAHLRSEKGLQFCALT